MSLMRSVLLTALAVVPVLATSSPSAAQQARVMQIEVGDNMKFAPAAMSAAPGESIKVVPAPLLHPADRVR
jgi:plastocyanin